MPDVESAIAAHREGIDAGKWQRLILLLRSSAQLVIPSSQAFGPNGNEQERKRAMDKVRTNARRLIDALGALDDEARDHMGFCIMGGAENGDTLARRSTELHGLKELQRLMAGLQRIESAGDLPVHPLRHRIEFLVACDVRNALQELGLPATAADTGLAADCFRAVAAAAGIQASDSPRYWIGKASGSEI